MSSKHTRFCFNNFFEDGTISVSSAQNAYPKENLYSPVKGRKWRSEGIFEITDQNNKVYINGSTFTLTNGSYIASQLITHFNSVTSQTLSRNSFGRFIITLGASGTLNLSNQTNAIWSTIGFLTTSDLTGTAFTADERRYNSGEWIQADLGVPQIVEFAALLPATETAFSMSNGTIKLQGNNVDVWTAPPVDLSFEVSSVGAFLVPSQEVQPCRYWRIFIDDVKNPMVEACVAYMGGSLFAVNTNLSVGFSRTFVDPSIKSYSESQQVYVERRTRYKTVTNCQVQYLKDSDRLNFENLFYELGQGRPFFVVIDPETQVSSSLKDLTYYCEVDGDPVFQHIISGYHSLQFNLREIV